MELTELFTEFDAMPRRPGFLAVIDSAVDLVGRLDVMASKLADGPAEQQYDQDPPSNPYFETLGALAQLWKSKHLGKFPQHPSSLGAALVLGGLGAAGGHLVGRAVDRFLPNDYVRADRAGMVLGGLLGATPGLASAYLNNYEGKPIWTSSFFDTRTAGFPGGSKQAAYGSTWGDSISVQDFQNAMWSDPRFVNNAPLELRAAASGIIQQAANLPGRNRNSSFVTPFDIARVAIGAGAGAASGWLVGKTLGAVFGTGQRTQELLKNTGMALGALKTVVPLVFDQEPYGYNNY